MSNPTPAQMNCGRCLYGPPALCTCGTCPPDEGEDECEHEQFEISWEGRATCEMCGTSWTASQKQIERQDELRAAAEKEQRYWDRVNEGCLRNNLLLFVIVALACALWGFSLAYAIRRRRPRRRLKGKITFWVKGEPMSQSTLKPGQSVPATVDYTSGGQPAQPASPPSWSSDTPGVASVTPSADGMSAVIAYVGPGAAVITVKAEGEGRILPHLIEAYPDSVERDDLAKAAGYAHAGVPNFRNSIGRLRSLGFVNYPDSKTAKAQATLFLEGR